MSTHINHYNDGDAIGKDHVPAVQLVGGTEGGGHVVDDEKDAAAEHHSLESSNAEAQMGVKGIEAVSMTWTKWGLIVAYLG